MGLFRRRDQTPAEPVDASPDPRDAEIAALRAALDDLRRELATRDDTDEALRAELRSANETLTARLEREATSLHGELTAARGHLEPTIIELGNRVDEIARRFETPLTDPPPPPEPSETVSRDDLDSVIEQIRHLEADLADRAEAPEAMARVRQLDERITAVDRRVTAVSTELANQLSEIDGDLEQLSELRDALAEARAAASAELATTTEPATGAESATGIDIDALDGLLDELRDAQQRLANEQVRYQIAFRDDLARLAEDLRRRSTR